MSRRCMQERRYAFSQRRVIDLFVIGISVKWNSNLESYEEKSDSIILHFQDQPDQEFDIVIGGKQNTDDQIETNFAADGVGSKVRKQMIGDPLKYTGYTVILGTIKEED